MAQPLTSGHFGSSFHFVNQFPRPARKNGHPILSSRFLSRVLVITISSHLNSIVYFYVNFCRCRATLWKSCNKPLLLLLLLLTSRNFSKLNGFLYFMFQAGLLDCHASCKVLRYLMSIITFVLCYASIKWKNNK
jgi:hypothetical protein